MENETQKLSWVELKHSIARQAGVSEKTASLFLHALVNETIASLKQGEPVRINKIGTFKMQTMAPRKSVHVATGEDIVIQEYKKISFAPDHGVKSQLNEESEPASDDLPMQKLNEQATEILDLLSDMGQSPQTTQPLQPEDTETAEETAEETTVTEKTEDTEEQKEREEEQLEEKTETNIEMEDNKEEATVPVTEEKQEEKKEEAQNPTVIPTFIPENKEERQEAVEEKKEDTEKEERRKRPFRPWLAAGITMTIFALLLIGGYLFLQQKIEQWVNVISQRIEQINPIETEDADNLYPAVTEGEAADETEAADQTENASGNSVAGQRTYTQFIATEAIPNGSRLAWLARKYYGNRDLWVFIYEANMDHLNHPSKILKGTKIRIPKLEEPLSDPDNPETRQLIKQLEREYLNR